MWRASKPLRDTVSRPGCHRQQRLAVCFRLQVPGIWRFVPQGKLAVSQEVFNYQMGQGWGGKVLLASNWQRLLNILHAQDSSVPQRPSGSKCHQSKGEETLPQLDAGVGSLTHALSRTSGKPAITLTWKYTTVKLVISTFPTMVLFQGVFIILWIYFREYILQRHLCTIRPYYVLTTLSCSGLCYFIVHESINCPVIVVFILRSMSFSFYN